MFTMLSFVACVLFTLSHGLVAEFNIEDKILEMSRKIQQLELSVSTLQAQNAAGAKGPIAFSAGLSKTIPVLGSHQQIVFDSVLTNIGNAYTTLHGHFVAPVKGAYAFFVTLTNVPHHSVSAQLMKNGYAMANVLAHSAPSDSGLYVTSSLAITVQLEAGDQVWVQNEGIWSVVEELDGGWSYFSGHLIGTMEPYARIGPLWLMHVVRSDNHRITNTSRDISCQAMILPFVKFCYFNCTKTNDDVYCPFIALRFAATVWK